MTKKMRSALIIPARPALSRRTFMQQAAATGLAAGGAGLLPGLARGASPVKGGHMRFGIGHGSTTDVLDPGMVLNGFLSSTHYAITNTLTEVDASGTLLPKLATEWDSSPDARVWSFKLRAGVEFHNGKTLDVSDVIASIHHHRRDGSESSAKSFVDSVADMKRDGSDRIIFELVSGDADFPFKLSSFNFPIYAAREDGTLSYEDGIGVGAYRLVEFRPGERALFEKNPNHWQDDRGHFDSGELLSIRDVAARTNALRTGEIDGMDRVDLKTVELLKKTGEVVVHEVEGKTHYTFPMNTRVGPFDNKDVRLALKLGLDRQVLLESVLFGHGSVGNDHPISSAYPHFNMDLEQRSHDPDKCRWHLRQAGFDNLNVELHVSDAAFPGAVDAAVLYSEKAATSGIDIKVVRTPSDGYWSEVWMQKPWCACYWPGYATQDSMFTQAYAAGAAWNDTFWENERFNRLLAEARSELDQGKRAQLYGEMQSLVRDDGGTVVPFFANDVFAVSKRVGLGDVSSNYEVDGRMFFERWWFNEA